MFRRTTQALVMNAEPPTSAPSFGPFYRSAPAAVLIAPDDSTTMATPEALGLLFEATGEPVPQNGAALPHAFRTRLGEIRHGARASVVPVISLSEDLVCRACVLRGNGGDYLLVLLESAGRRDAARQAMDMCGFTPREDEVAVLVTEGLSNRDIADRLCVTENTVESHIKRILTKAQVSSRAALVSKVLGGSA